MTTRVNYSTKERRSCSCFSRKRISTTRRRTRLLGDTALGIFLFLAVMRCSSGYIQGLARLGTSRLHQRSSKALSQLNMALDSRELRFYEGRTLFGEHFAEYTHSTYSTSAHHATAMAATMVDSILTVVKSGNRHSRRQFSSDASSSPSPKKSSSPSRQYVPKQGYGPSIQLTDEERDLFNLLRQVRIETHLDTTLRVAGGWVRDKLLATPEFQAYHKVFDVGGQRLTSKFHKPSGSKGRQGIKIIVHEDTSQPVDIDIALDDMVGREFADHLNEYLTMKGQDTVSVGVVLKNPEKSKHLETATMKVGSFWIDFVNLRAEEYTQDSRIPDLMRIGTAAEDAFRRDLTINALFYNINTGQVEDWTGRGFDDLRKGVVTTPLPPLTTLLDDPLRVLRSIRFAARLRFNMGEELVDAARDESVRNALAQKVSRERVGGEVDLMLRSPDPVGAMRLLMNLGLVDTVFPISQYLSEDMKSSTIFEKGLHLLSTTHDHLVDHRLSPPLWCKNMRTVFGTEDLKLTKTEEARRLLWYASFLKPLWDHAKMQSAKKAPKRQGKKANRCAISRLLVDELKRPIRDADAVEKIMRAADDFTQLMNSGCDISATMILLSDVRVTYSAVNGKDDGVLACSMNGRHVESDQEEDPIWKHAMEFRQLCSRVLHRIGPLWRAALFLSISEQLASLDDSLEYTIEGDTFEESQEERRNGVIERFDAFATALQQLGMIGVWNEKPLFDGGAVKKVLPGLPKGPAFRDVMDEQSNWLITHPGADAESLAAYLKKLFPEFVGAEK